MTIYRTPNLHVPYETLKSLTKMGFWERSDLPLKVVGELADFLESDKTLGVLISGSLGPVVAHDHEGIIAGFDWIRIEENPKAGESEINVNHFIVGTPDANRLCPIYGPYKTGAHLPHWVDLEQIPKILLGKDSIEGNES